MRLTLRTLLAYMDGLLEPDDAQDIAKKIEESQFATDLYHRIRDVMRRLRLTAPSLTERAASLDPNTVGEYLDNVLPSDRVQDFEEVCLKSDVHLAEVSACHQILTLVLSEPVEIDPASRQRMYQIPQEAEKAEEERLAAAPSGDGSASRKNRPKPMVPEYLRDHSKKRRLLPTAALLLLAGGFAGIVLMAFGQFEPGSYLGDAFISVRDRFEAAAVPEINEEASDQAAGTEPVAPKPSEEKTPSKAVAAADAAGKEPDKTGPAKPEVTQKAPPTPATPDAAAAPKAPDKVEPGVVAAVPGKPAETKPKTDVTPAVPPELLVPKPGELAKTDVKPLPKPDEKKPNELPPAPLPPALATTAKPTVPEAAKTPPAAEEAQRVGRFISDGQDVLLKFDAAANVWKAVTREEFLVSRQPLLALPTYRPRVVILKVGATVEMLSGTRIELLPEDPQGQPGFEITYGRVVMKPLAQAGVRVRLVGGGHSGTLELSQVDSIAAMEVRRFHDPGTDPETQPSHASAELYVARGTAIWAEDGDKKPVELAGPVQWRLDEPPPSDLPVDDGSKVATMEMPKWITGDTVSRLDRDASTFLSQSLKSDRSANLVLRELTDHRKIEVRWLAARCLGYLGQFDPIVAALNDESFKREWPDYVEQLRQAMARGPQIAIGVHQAMEKQFGKDARPCTGCSGAIRTRTWRQARTPNWSIISATIRLHSASWRFGTSRTSREWAFITTPSTRHRDASSRSSDGKNGWRQARSG